MTSKLFSELGLSPALLKAIDRLGYEKAAPIQSEAIPLIIGGSDVCFSATMAKGIVDLINRFSRDPKTIRIDHKVLTVPTVEQAYYEIRGRSKTEALTRLIDLHDLKLGIIFCNTKRMVDDLTDELVARGYSADRIHGDMSQPQRELVMTKFRNSGLEFLEAMTLATRIAVMKDGLVQQFADPQTTYE
jgi:superfamily II DNA/RNA helicase